jgi:hypothetical protein
MKLAGQSSTTNKGSWILLQGSLLRISVRTLAQAKARTRNTRSWSNQWPFGRLSDDERACMERDEITIQIWHSWIRLKSNCFSLLRDDWRNAPVYEGRIGLFLQSISPENTSCFARRRSLAFKPMRAPSNQLALNLWRQCWRQLSSYIALDGPQGWLKGCLEASYHALFMKKISRCCLDRTIPVVAKI